MGLNIYFLDKDGNDIEIESHLQVTHNLNSVVNELGLITGEPYYELVWRPDELLNCENGKVKVNDVRIHLPSLS